MEDFTNHQVQKLIKYLSNNSKFYTSPHILDYLNYKLNIQTGHSYTKNTLPTNQTIIFGQNFGKYTIIVHYDGKPKAYSINSFTESTTGLHHTVQGKENFNYMDWLKR